MLILRDPFPSWRKTHRRSNPAQRSRSQGWRSASILAAWLTLACQPTTPSDPVPDRTASIEPLPQDPDIRVYFNHNEAQRYTDPYRQIERPGDDLEAEIITAIASAKTQINLAVQEFRLPKIAAALIERQQAGVKVRVVIENSYNQSWSDLTTRKAQLDDRARSRYDDLTQLIDQDGDGNITPTELGQRDAIAMLRSAGIPLIDDTADGSKGSGLMHHKFVSIDGQRAIITSANFTSSDIHGDISDPSSRGNANNLLAIENSELAALLDREFAQLWGDGVGQSEDSRFGVKKEERAIANLTIGKSLVSVRFSPSSSRIPLAATTNGLIVAAIGRATRSADLALFVFSSQEIADALQVRQAAGVEVRALIDPQFAFRDYSEALDLAGVALPNPACEVEPGNAPWSSPIASVGMPDLTPGDVLHHKFATIDDRLVLTGSHNWSEAANRNNDELLLVIQNPIIAAHFEREFERLYRTARLGLPERIAEKVASSAKSCPSVPVENKAQSR
ncbi:MAG: competence protein ComE [Oscillatoriales cyanobacterium]|nr:MAG: competence protein ComE [Oscillatoriales cyanobacterium]